MKPRLLIGGAYVAPEVYQLLEALFTELFAQDFHDLEDVLAARLFSDTRVLHRVRVGFYMHRWECTPWGEMVLRQLLADATKAGVTRDQRRAAIDQTLLLALPCGRPS